MSGHAIGVTHVVSTKMSSKNASTKGLANVETCCISMHKEKMEYCVEAAFGPRISPVRPWTLRARAMGWANGHPH